MIESVDLLKQIVKNIENVIIGKLIPAGTGSKNYRDISYELESEFVDEEPLEKLEDQLME